ncbi:hypothetical protein VNI00_015884 [Paramarasmius palmivorus]|uniref:Uncharacterized protein n=1 Tax=Paramarasmius palmivorus TaxID=297713 RepID=A0AAW0BH00_9AGAR
MKSEHALQALSFNLFIESKTLTFSALRGHRLSTQARYHIIVFARTEVSLLSLAIDALARDTSLFNGKASISELELRGTVKRSSDKSPHHRRVRRLHPPPISVYTQKQSYFNSSAHQPFSNTSSIKLCSLSDRQLMELSSEEPQALDNLSTGLLVLGRGLPTSTFWSAKLGSSLNLVCNKNQSNLPLTFVDAFNLKDTENRIKTAPQAFGPVDS